MGFFKSELCLCTKLLWIKYCSSSVLGKKQNYEDNADWNKIKYRAQIFTIKLISPPFVAQCNYLIFAMCFLFSFPSSLYFYLPL